MSPIRVLPLEIYDDPDLVREAETAAFEDAEGTAAPSRLEAHLARLREAQAAGSYLALAAEADGRRIGVLLADTSAPRTMYVDDLYVRPAARRRGAARALLTRLHELARERGADVELSVTATNEAAMRLYAELGYVVTRHRLRWRADRR